MISKKAFRKQCNDYHKEEKEIERYSKYTTPKCSCGRPPISFNNKRSEMKCIIGHYFKVYCVNNQNLILLGGTIRRRPFLMKYNWDLKEWKDMTIEELEAGT